MPEHILSCPLCGSDRSQPFDRRLFREQVVLNRICNRCGLVYQSPRPTDPEREAFYAQTYRQLYGGSAEPTVRDLTVQRARAEALLAFSRPFLTAVSTHLDIGCSVGALLQRFAEAYSCRPVGIEPGEEHRAYAQRQGLEIYPSLQALEKADSPSFDLISMAHVLEHLPAPLDYLRQLRTSWLKPNGWLLVEVPNLYAHDCFEIAHLLSFSVHTLRQILELAGYQIIHWERHGRPRSRLIPYYITVLARPRPFADQATPLRPERLVSLKRKLGLFRRRLLTRLFPRQAWQEIG